MNFDQKDIENSKTHLLSIIVNGNLNLQVENVTAFVYFICDYFTRESIKGNLLQTIQSLSLNELQTIFDLFTEEQEFDILISKSFQLEKRELLKNNLIQLEIEGKESSLDDTVTKAFQLEKRDGLKHKLKVLDTETRSKKAKVISMQTYVAAICIAASIILIFIVWQPQHLSNGK